MRLLASVFVLFLLPLGAAAQQAPATLIADQVAVEGNNRLRASGNVEVFFDETTLRATSIVYDRRTDQLTIEGPLTVLRPDGSFLLADSAALSSDLRTGILRSARLVLNRQLQLAAAEIRRIGGRYSVLGKTVASSCQICPGSPVPLWRIRARRIIHDELERQLYFDNARLEVMGVPVFYLPRLRLPDPTLKRANGFLTPSLRVNDKLGTGLKLPYFVTLGRHADLTVTPYVTTGGSRTVELRFRRAFRSGRITMNGALTRDDLRPGEDRRYLFADGRFDLPRGFDLTFGIKAVSDPAYLLDYAYSDADRLPSTIDISRTRRDEHIHAGLRHVNSLRASENNSTLPNTIGSASWQRRFEMPVLGGTTETRLELFGFRRASDADVIGRDGARASARLDWRRDWITPQGMLLAAQGRIALDYYAVDDDSTATTPETRATPFGAIEMRWPLLRAGVDGATHVLEPVAQLVWSPVDDSGIVNEDSLSVDFDEGNLFALDRFPGADRYEQGLRANLGLGWTRHDPAGWSLGVTVGRVLRERNLSQFATGTGLGGYNSDWLAAMQLTTAGNLRVSNRAVFDDSFNFTRDELRMDWRTERLGLTSSFIWQQANPLENRPTDSAEWLMDTSYRFRPNWTGKANWRYDFVTGSAAEAGLGLVYRNECVEMNVSLSRRFTSSTSVTPTTNFGLTIALTGFGTTPGESAYRRNCAR